MKKIKSLFAALCLIGLAFTPVNAANYVENDSFIYTAPVAFSNLVMTNTGANISFGGSDVITKASWSSLYSTATGSVSHAEFVSSNNALYAVATGSVQRLELIGTNDALIIRINGITNGLATTSITNGFVTSSITNGLSTIVYVNGITNGLASTSITNGLATTSITNGLVSMLGWVEPRYVTATWAASTTWVPNIGNNAVLITVATNNGTTIANTWITAPAGATGHIYRATGYCQADAGTNVVMAYYMYTTNDVGNPGAGAFIYATNIPTTTASTTISWTNYHVGAIQVYYNFRRSSPGAPGCTNQNNLTFQRIEFKWLMP